MKFSVDEFDLMISALFDYERKLEEFKDMLDFISDNDCREPVRDVYTNADEKYQLCNKLLIRFERELRKET